MGRSQFWPGKNTAYPVNERTTTMDLIGAVHSAKMTR
jgi:hypothetical protein